MCEQVKRQRTRGQWHVCAWCGEEFEGAPLPGGYCSKECWEADGLDPDMGEFHEEMRDLKTDLIRR